MKKISLTFFITFILIKSGFGQINIDSLKNELKNYRIENEVNESGIRSVTYINNTLKYIINYDKTKEITDNLWGVGIIAYQYDSLKREISIITYNKNGDLYSADSPPIVKTKYFDNVEQIEYYYKKDKLASRIDIYKDSKGREIQFIGYDSNLKMKSKHSTEYIDSSNVKLKRYYDSTNVLTKNKCGVAVWYKKYDSNDEKFIIEEMYLDENLQPIDCVDFSSGLGEKAFSKITYTKLIKEQKIKVQYLTKKGKIIEEFITNMPKI